MKFSAFAAFLFLGWLSAGCQGTKNRVIGQLASAPYEAPASVEIITRSGPDGGVKLSADVGEGKRMVTLSGAETARLIDAMERELKAWPMLWRSAPFQRTLAMGITSVSDWTPYAVELIKRPQMRTAVFRVTIGYADARGSMALDEANARRWLERLKKVSGYRGAPVAPAG